MADKCLVISDTYEGGRMLYTVAAESADGAEALVREALGDTQTCEYTLTAFSLYDLKELVAELEERDDLATTVEELREQYEIEVDEEEVERG